MAQEHQRLEPLPERLRPTVPVLRAIDRILRDWSAGWDEAARHQVQLSAGTARVKLETLDAALHELRGEESEAMPESGSFSVSDESFARHVIVEVSDGSSSYASVSSSSADEVADLLDEIVLTASAWASLHVDDERSPGFPTNESHEARADLEPGRHHDWMFLKRVQDIFDEVAYLDRGQTFFSATLNWSSGRTRDVESFEELQEAFPGEGDARHSRISLSVRTRDHRVSVRLGPDDGWGNSNFATAKGTSIVLALGACEAVAKLSRELPRPRLDGDAEEEGAAQPSYGLWERAKAHPIVSSVIGGLIVFAISVVLTALF